MAHPRRAHPHEDAGHVDLRHQRVVELRLGVAARRRLLHRGFGQAGDLQGGQGSRHGDVERHRRVRAVPASATRFADARLAGRQFHWRIDHDRAGVEHRAVRGELRRLPRHHLGQHGEGRQRAGADGHQSADDVFVHAVDAAAARTALRVANRVADQRDRREPVARRRVRQPRVHDGRRGGPAGGADQPEPVGCGNRREHQPDAQLVERRRRHDLQRCVRHDDAAAAGRYRSVVVVVRPGRAGAEHDLFLARHRGDERRHDRRPDLVVRLRYRQRRRLERHRDLRVGHPDREPPRRVEQSCRYHGGRGHQAFEP